ncbi:MAG: RNA polymerase sigma factor [Nannocystaceae bacterium]|nr:RNA polymerase sigma factor [Nannocystaceae bacterium]
MDDLELLARWKDGDNAAGDALVRQHYVSVRRFFEARLSRVADDLTQRTFLACLEGVAECSPEVGFRPYLFGIARNIMLMQLRQTQQRGAAQPRVNRAFSPETRTSLTGLFARREEHHYVLRALAALPMDLQVAMQLVYWEGLNAREVGQVLGISGSAVRSRLSKARAEMASHFERLRLPHPLSASLKNEHERWTQEVAVTMDASAVSAPKRLEGPEPKG